jgi:flagellar biosynthetic protein FliQ
MTDTTVVNMAAQALLLVLKLAGPILAATLVVGIVVSVLQAVTSVQESTLSFVPKLIAVGLVVLFAGHWMVTQVTTYTDSLFGGIARLVNAG